uniref:Beta-glucosidase (EC) n=1 Tax=Ganoderma boninense TaxID=34458 RepID=A0A5K1K1I9_9APHY|nr:Beta-glucosidase (EC [Ganoderma boninense]
MNHRHDRLQNSCDGVEDFAAANTAYFDQRAHQLGDHGHGHELGRKNVAAMRKAWPELFDEDRTVAMDYACGIGNVSQTLCQYVKSVVGVDISQASVDRFNTQAANQGLEPDEMRAVCAELKGEPDELDRLKFDMIICCASYHHFPSIAETTRVLASFLKPGGALLVADIKAEEDGRVIFPEVHHHLVPHTHGLSEETMRGAFDNAGLAAFEMRESFRAKMRSTGGHVRWFVARGVMPHSLWEMDPTDEPIV